MLVVLLGEVDAVLVFFSGETSVGELSKNARMALGRNSSK